MNDDTNKTAIWVPGWYELDQPLIVGTQNRYWFFQDPPVKESAAGQAFDFMFFNELSSEKNCEFRNATVVEISHPELGQLRRIDTDGLDYIFYPIDGDEIIVNAEEEPGTMYDRPGAIEDWSVSVILSNVSEPVPDYV